MAEDLYVSVDRYISEQFSQDDHALQAVGRSLEEAGISNISVSSSQGKLLLVLAQLCGASG